jgi:hypothetical protein
LGVQDVIPGLSPLLSIHQSSHCIYRIGTRRFAKSALTALSASSELE